MKIRTDFVTNSSSTGYVVVTITTTKGTERATDDYDTGYGGWIWNNRSIDSVLEDLNKVKNGEELYKVLMDSVESFEYFSQDVNRLLENIKSRDDLIEIELEEETRSDEVEDHDIYKFRLKYDFKDSKVIELEHGYFDDYDENDENDKNQEGITSIIIPEGVTSIENGAYYGCSNLNSITIPASVTSIGDGAFSGCSDTLNVYVHDLGILLNIVFGVEWGLGSDKNLFINGELTRNIVIPYGVTSIGKNAFNGFTFESITLPNSVTSIEDYAISDCINLKSIIIPNSVTKIGEGAFRCCSDLTDITIPGSVTVINVGAFEDCESLTSVVLLDGVNSIESCAFSNCENLKSITIPKSVTSISKWAFLNIYTEEICENLTIHAPSGSYAEEYAKENNIPFEAFN